MGWLQAWVAGISFAIIRRASSEFPSAFTARLRRDGRRGRVNYLLTSGRKLL
jgi:hypothetical protein